MQLYSDRYVRTMKSLSLLNAGQEFIMTAGLLAATLMAVFAVRSCAMQAGDIMDMILILANIYRSSNILGFSWREIKQDAVDMEKRFDLLDTKPEMVDAPSAVPLIVTKGGIRFKDVRFAHVDR